MTTEFRRQVEEDRERLLAGGYDHGPAATGWLLSLYNLALEHDLNAIEVLHTAADTVDMAAMVMTRLLRKLEEVLPKPKPEDDDLYALIDWYIHDMPDREVPETLTDKHFKELAPIAGRAPSTIDTFYYNQYKPRKELELLREELAELGITDL